jgi:hypothetical protein
MPRIVRRRPLFERITAFFDPLDFWLFVSEELNDDAYEELLNNWATPIGIALNAVFIIARGASAGKSAGSNDLFGDDVFTDFDGKRSSGWFACVVSTPYCCTCCCLLYGLILTLNIGNPPRPHPDRSLLPQCFLHFLPQTPLPPLRAARRLSSKHALGEARSC